MIRRPARVLLMTAGVAVVSLIVSGVLDHHADWGDPRQAIANVAWLVFLISALTFVVLGVRYVARRRRTLAHD